MTAATLTREEVVEKAARAIVRYEVWHREQLAESKERRGREKYVARGQNLFAGPTAWDFLDEFAGDDQHLFVEIAHEANVRARELREL